MSFVGIYYSCVVTTEEEKTVIIHFIIIINVELEIEIEFELEIFTIIIEFITIRKWSQRFGRIDEPSERGESERKRTELGGNARRRDGAHARF